MARRIRWQIVTAAVSGLLIAALLGALALRTAGDAGPTPGGIYIEGLVGAAPASINPLLDTPEANPVGYDLAALVYQGLMRIGDLGYPELDLAQESTVDDSGTVYTFTLPADARWHDGQPLTARDVVFTVDAVKGEGFAGDPALRSLWGDVSADAVDEHTVRFTLPAPFAPFLSMARLPIVPAHLFGSVAPAQWAEAPFSRQPVGSGPFRLQQLGPEGATLAANPGYRSARTPQRDGSRLLLDRLELRFFATAEAALGALERREIQGLAYEPPPGLRPAFPVGTRAAALPLDGYTILSFNTRDEPLRDTGLRRALTRGLDRGAVAAAVGEQVTPLETPILPGSWAYHAGVRAPEHDAAAAERLLGELGYVRGADGVLARGAQRLSLPLITDGAPEHAAAAAAIASQWGALGAEVRVQQLDGPALRAALRAHTFVLALHSFSRLGPDPDPFELWHSTQAADGLNYAGVADEQLDAFITGARGEAEANYRSDDYSAFAERWLELAPAIMLYQPTLTVATAPQVGGTGLDAPPSEAGTLLYGRADRYRNVVNWYVGARVIDDLRR